ncbi:unnamed protein product [Rotaria sp. Silwood2]|nr:unnamed protein product [Rotaria sp. Silwood2]CAF4076494.1 unnamed protein product [Rotaria sp. Silwood2]
MPSVNSAPSKSKRAAANTIISRRPTTSTNHATRPQQTTSVEKVSPVRTTTHAPTRSSAQTTKRTTARPTSKVTTTRRSTTRNVVRGKRSNMKPETNKNRQKRLSQWDWV